MELSILDVGGTVSARVRLVEQVAIKKEVVFIAGFLEKWLFCSRTPWAVNKASSLFELRAPRNYRRRKRRQLNAGNTDAAACRSLASS